MPRTPSVEATLSCPNPDNHLVEVTLRIPALSEPSDRTLVMPKWIPGSYKIRDFGRHVQDLSVAAPGRTLPVQRTRTDGWTFHDPATGPLTVTYRVYCRDLTVDTSHVTATHLYVHGVTTFLYDDALRGMPWRVSVKVPKGWGIWAGLPSEGDHKGKPVGGAWPPELNGAAVFLADDYDHLVDCPIEAGVGHHVERFRAAGKAHRLVVWNPPRDVDWQKVTHDLANLVEEAAAVFGGLPYKDYTFIAHVAKGHGGGLEHKNSTVLGVDPLHLTDPKLYESRWLPLCAHEFFHVWNVRRIQPAAFRPFDYQQEVLTGLLWLFEGGTSYMEVPLLLRAKLGKPESAYEVLADMIKYTEMSEGRHRLSVADASRLTWTKLYQRHESNINTNVSYYSKGAVVCFCLDAHLREHGKNIDQVFQYLAENHGEGQRGVPEGGVPDIVKAATGLDVRRLINAWVEHPGELPVERACRTLGLKIERKHTDAEAKLGLGIQLDGDGMKVTSIPDRWKDGVKKGSVPGVPHPLDPGDEIVAVDGWKVTEKDLGKFVNAKKDGEEISVTIFRDGRLRSVAVPVREKNPDKIAVVEDKKADAAAKRRRSLWKKSRA